MLSLSLHLSYYPQDGAISDTGYHFLAGNMDSGDAENPDDPDVNISGGSHRYEEIAEPFIDELFSKVRSFL